MTKDEALKAMILRAEHNERDLHETDNGHVVICAEDIDGTLYDIGYVTESLILQNPKASWKCIERIKFGG